MGNNPATGTDATGANTGGDSNNLLDIGIDLMGNGDAGQQSNGMVGGGMGQQTDLLGGSMDQANQSNSNDLLGGSMNTTTASTINTSGPQTQYSLDGMMGMGGGSGAPTGGNFLD